MIDVTKLRSSGDMFSDVTHGAPNAKQDTLRLGGSWEEIEVHPVLGSAQFKARNVAIPIVTSGGKQMNRQKPKV